jgi:hypothetical protein
MGQLSIYRNSARPVDTDDDLTGDVARLRQFLLETRWSGWKDLPPSGKGEKRSE